MSADRDRETRLAEAIVRVLTEPMPEWHGGPDHDYWLMRAARVLALPAFRAAGEGDRLRRDLAAEVERLSGGPIALRVVADRLQRLLDGGEGGR